MANISTPYQWELDTVGAGNNPGNPLGSIRVVPFESTLTGFSWGAAYHDLVGPPKLRVLCLFPGDTVWEKLADLEFSGDAYGQLHWMGVEGEATPRWGHLPEGTLLALYDVSAEGGSAGQVFVALWALTIDEVCAPEGGYYSWQAELSTAFEQEGIER